MKLIIAGSRDITSSLVLEDGLLLSEFDNIEEIVSGTAKGPDTLGEEYGNRKGINIARFPADWNTHGKAAGPIRNKEMGDYADAALILWDGESKGSYHMYNYMKSLRKPCFLHVVNISYHRFQDTIVKEYSYGGVLIREYPDGAYYRV